MSRAPRRRAPKPDTKTPARELDSAETKAIETIVAASLAPGVLMVKRNALGAPARLWRVSDAGGEPVDLDEERYAVADLASAEEAGLVVVQWQCSAGLAYVYPSRAGAHWLEAQRGIGS